jgi:sec-independent protein translocase protein TatA
VARATLGVRPAQAPIPRKERLAVDFSPIQLIIVLVIVLLVFGAKRLPEIGRNLGTGAREFKDGITGHSRHDDGEAISGPPPEREDEKVG